VLLEGKLQLVGKQEGITTTSTPLARECGAQITHNMVGLATHRSRKRIETLHFPIS
jgi:hypothetical protein